MADLVTSADAAEILGVSRQRVHQLVDEGHLRAQHVLTAGPEWKRMLVFRRSDVERCKADRERRGLRY